MFKNVILFLVFVLKYLTVVTFLCSAVACGPICLRSVQSWDSFTSVEVDQTCFEDGGGG